MPKAKLNDSQKKQTATVPKEEWELRHISANEKDILKKVTETFERELNQFKSGEIYQDYQKVRTLTHSHYTNLSNLIIDCS